MKLCHESCPTVRGNLKEMLFIKNACKKTSELINKYRNDMHKTWPVHIVFMSVNREGTYSVHVRNLDSAYGIHISTPGQYIWYSCQKTWTVYIVFMSINLQSTYSIHVSKPGQYIVFMSVNLESTHSIHVSKPWQYI